MPPGVNTIDSGAKMLLSLALLLFCVLPLALCAEDYYKLLDIDKSASDRDIKRAYRTLSKKYHPDKNPYVSMFDNLSVWAIVRRLS